MNKSKNRREIIVNQIKELIIANGLQPGSLLPTELELCEDLQASRSSIREAIRALATLGIVEVRHGHGTFVGDINLDALVETVVFRGILHAEDNFNSLREIIDIRQHLDLAYTDTLINAFAGTSNPELHEHVQAMISKAAEHENFAQNDREFHIGLFNRTNNSLMSQLVGAFWDIHTAMLPQLGLRNPADMTITAQSHLDMLEALESGDSEKWRESVQAHYAPLIRVIALDP